MFALVAVAAVVFSATLAHGSTSVTSVTLKVAYNKKLKLPIVVDGRGRTVYMYAADKGWESTCVDDATYHCIKIWPAVRAAGAVRVGPGLKKSLISTVERGDGGARQVRYAHHPLYYDAGSVGFGIIPDKKPGDINGQTFGDLWYVLSPSGKVIKKYA
jgi:predicted lipoprotein with Yx(FWY)xxD motif